MRETTSGLPAIAGNGAALRAHQGARQPRSTSKRVSCLFAEAIARMSEEGEKPIAVGGEERHGTLAVSWLGLGLGLG